MYKIIAIILVAAAVTLLLFHNYIIDKDTTNTTLAYIHKNNQLIASVLALAGYFAYTQSQSELSTVPSQPELPTYESIGTEEALNL